MYMNAIIKFTKSYFTPRTIIVNSRISTHLSFFCADFLLWHTYMIARATVVIASGMVTPRIIRNVDQSETPDNFTLFH